MKAKKRWVGRSDWRMAQAAEAVGVPTDHVLGVIPRGEHLFVFYRPDLDVLEMKRAKLTWDDAGLLRRVVEDIDIPDPLAVERDPERLFNHLA